MSMLKDKPWVRYEEGSKTVGKFIVEPLDRGYGYTLGNALRRVLISSLQGAAITAVKIEGVSHEFSTMQGVVEDVLQIILNLKEIVFKSHSDAPKVITLKAKGGKVLASMIEHDVEIEVMNPDHVIATLDTNGKLEFEAIVEKGKGFAPSERNKKANLPIGYIPIDSLFTPVTKVNLTVEEVRVGQEINSDRLIIDVVTNGSITPDAAMVESARILSKHVEMFVRLGEQVDVPVGAAEKNESIDSQVLDMSIDDLELSARPLNCLKRANIKTVGDLMQYSYNDLKQLKNLGKKSFLEIVDKLSEYKLVLNGSEEAEEGEA